MQTIDFIKGIGYEIISFPDGEKHLKINELNRKDTVEIVCRICNSDDLFLLMQLTGFSRFIYNNFKDRFLSSRKFYFTSNLLDVNTRKGEMLALKADISYRYEKQKT
jgi:hypothetical protein